MMQYGLTAEGLRRLRDAAVTEIQSTLEGRTPTQGTATDQKEDHRL